MRPAIIYDGSVRDSGTPYYFRAALSEVLGYDVDWFTQAGEIGKGYDAYLMIDDGRDDLTNLPPDPWGFYCTDSHLGPSFRFEKAKRAAVTWCAQRPFADALRGQGINAKWLPLACSPRHHPTAHELAAATSSDLPERRYDIAFIGHLQAPTATDRIAFLDGLFRAFPNFRYRYGIYHTEMAHAYHESKIGVNHSVAPGEEKDLNMRFFELASLGVPQLCDERMVGLKDLGYKPFADYLPYRSVDDAIAIVREYMGDPSLEVMAGNALNKVRLVDTYEARVRVMLRDMECLTKSDA
jgi:hypothetical protein